jgi:hypothetical protein
MAISRLEEFWRLYNQDFDLIFARDTDPIDLFCQQHNEQAQRALLRELNSFYDGVLCGRNSVRDLVKMGLEYVPSDDENPAIWLPPLIDYLAKKIANSGERQPKT